MRRGDKYSGNLFIGCTAGGLQMAGTIFGLVYGTREPGELMLGCHNGTVKGFAGNQREMYNGSTLEEKKRRNISGVD